jgi:hypothetical protein
MQAYPISVTTRHAARNLLDQRDLLLSENQLSVRNPLRKKVQDEKYWAKTRMNRYTESELAKAFQAFLPMHEDALLQKLSLWRPQSTKRPRTTSLPKAYKHDAKLAIPV